MSDSETEAIVRFDDSPGESRRTTTCTNISKHHRGYPVERKVIDPAGRLGSLYDSSTDRLIDRHSVRSSSEKYPSKHYICQLFSGHSSRSLNDVLENIGFNDSLRRNIRRPIVTPFGLATSVQYNQPINQNTRFLYYSYRARKEKLSVEARKAQYVVPPPQGPTEANCLITKIEWGIEFLCIIHIPPKQDIDELLRFVQKRLKMNRIPLQLTNETRQLINGLHNVTIYGSETCINDPFTPILDVLTRIPDWQRNAHYHQPPIYTTQPLRWLYNNIQFPEPCDEVDPYITRAKETLRRIENQMKDLDELFYNFPTKFSSTILKQRLTEFRRHYELLFDRHEEVQKRFQEIILDIRRHGAKSVVLDNIIADMRYQSLYDSEMRQFRVNVERLLDKAVLIEKLKNDRIEYVNAFDVGSNGRSPMTNEVIDAQLKRSFPKGNGTIILWYSGDRLRREQGEKWKQIYQQLTSERQQATQLINLVYVDFTQCKQPLEKFIIVRLPHTSRSDLITEALPSRSKSDPSSPATQPRPLYAPPRKTDRPPPPPPLETSEISNIEVVPPPPVERPRQSSPRTEINVLLLGETLVGKSTFINAFVNYLKFETLEQAERGEPVVLIPASFLLTIGDQFDEFIVKYGNVDSNEDHEHQGQSLTQHCKSYLFDLNDQFSLRLIDTPGIGDARGTAQDVKNIDHILTYINTLPHLNAVCLLLKPTASRLNVFFHSCINQLLTYLTPIGFTNIIFCFTNARSTFYTPGDTGRLLREMLNQEHLNEIPFQKQNTFCFDSESFRYLAARRCQIDFADYQTVECRNSWNTSVKESIRLLDFIQTRQPYNLQEYQSPRKVVSDITMFARSFMETLRLIIYNWKITEAKLVFDQMILSSNLATMETCTHCAQINHQEVGPLWIAQYQPAAIETVGNEHRLCPSVENHFLIEAVVQHEFASEGAGLRVEQWQSSFYDFLLKCDRIYHFLCQQGPSAQTDPFGPIIARFLEEEQQISHISIINSDMNRRVRKVLQSIRQIRERNSQQLFEMNERLSVKDVYRIIDELIRIPTVKVLIDSIKRSRELIMKTQEQKISANIIQN